MSLIYEALRKSEEERRLGETPTLLGHEPASWRHAREELERRRRTRWLLLPVLLGAIVAGWLIGNRPQAPARDATRQGTETVRGEGARALPAGAAPSSAAAAQETPAASVPNAVPAAESATDSAALPRGADDVAAKDGVDPATLQRFEQGLQFANSADQLKPVQPTRETPVVPPDAQLPPPLSEPEPEPASAAPSVADVPAPVSVPPPAPPVLTPPEPIAAVVTAPPASAPAEPPAPEPAGVPSIHLLPLEVRRSLPPLILSMHVYAQDPARRFVLLDDVRMVQGDANKGVTLREVRVDGVVLEYNGQAFFVPRSGQ